MEKLEERILEANVCKNTNDKFVNEIIIHTVISVNRKIVSDFHS